MSLCLTELANAIGSDRIRQLVVYRYTYRPLDLAEAAKPRKSGSQRTRRWSKRDSNPRSLS